MAKGLTPYIRQRSLLSWSVTYRGKERAFRGRTKSEALANARDWIAEVERDHHGLEARLKPHTVGSAFEQYKETAKYLASWDSIEGRWNNYLLPKFGGTLLTKLKPHEVDVFFKGLLKENGGPLSAGTVAHLRNTFRRLYTWASTKGRLFRGRNPISETDAPDLPDPEPKAIADADLMAIIRAAETKEDQMLLATAFLTGMRKGELLGLRKDVVEIPNARIMVAKSYKKKTKTKKALPIPIPRELLSYFEAWIKATPGDLMFPDPDGQPRTKHFDAAGMFRRCMLRAGLIRGYLLECRKRKPKRPAAGARNGRAKLDEHQVAQVKAHAEKGERHTDIARVFGVSRRLVTMIVTGKRWSSRPRLLVGCGKKVEVSAPVVQACPDCGAPMRCTALPLDYLFRHTRSTFITRVVESTGDIRAAQLLARHASYATTERSYAARRVEHLRSAVDGLAPVLNAGSNSADDLPMGGAGHRQRVTVSASDHTRKADE